MPKQYFSNSGVNTYINPLLQDGVMIHCVNMVSFPLGAKTKRQGYTAVGTAGTAEVDSMFTFTTGGSQFFYAKSGSLVYQGTAPTTLAIAGNGTVSGTARVGYAILADTLVIGDGVGSTRHTTNGTSFTNTTLAPIAAYFKQYQNRIYAAGTANTLFYSTTNDASNWNTSGTSDSSSFTIPGDGHVAQLFKTNDQLIQTKDSGEMYKWDGYSLIDMSTRFGPSSPYSVAKSENFVMFLNEQGIYGFNGNRPQILSNNIQRQIYNDTGGGISTTIFGTAAADTIKYDYFVSVGTVTDDFVQRPMSNCIIKYDFIKNEFLNWSLGHKATSILGYTDTSHSKKLVFGSSSGLIYQVTPSSYTDNGTPINTEMIFVYHYGEPEYDKKWNWWRGIFNPGCQARVQIATSNKYTYTSLKWTDLGDCSDGIAEYRPVQGNAQSKFLFVKIYDSSTTARFTYYGSSIDAKVLFQR